MSGETQAQESGWTVDTSLAFQRLNAEWQVRFGEERDRRYSEVALEREKALKIKETADLAALQLAREIQTYKDEKANELRSQIERERGSYATKTDLIAMQDRFMAELRPVTTYVTEAQTRSATQTEGHSTRRSDWGLIVTVIGLALTAIAVMTAVLVATFGS